MNTYKILLSAILFILAQNLNIAQWQSELNTGSRVLSIKHFDKRIYIGTEDNGVWFSKDNGENWNKLQIGNLISSYDVNDFESNGQSTWIGSRGGNVIFSENGETNWQMLENGFMTQAYISKILLIEDTLFAANSSDVGLQASGIYRTLRDSINWQISGTGIPQTLLSISSFILSKTKLMYVGAQFAGLRRNLYVSKDYGRSWVPRSLEDYLSVNSLVEYSDFIYAGTSNGIYFTSDNDSTWHKLSVELENYYIDDFVIKDNRIYAAVDEVGIITSDDFGTTWNNITFDLPIEEDYVSKIYIIDGILYAGLGSKSGLWKIPISLTDIVNGEGPKSIHTLQQNYPNPFNPKTIINYTLAESGKVTLKVYDLLGKEIKTLVSKEQVKGEHKIEFDGEDLASGVYIYKLETDSFVNTKKMLLLK